MWEREVIQDFIAWKKLERWCTALEGYTVGLSVCPIHDMLLVSRRCIVSAFTHKAASIIPKLHSLQSVCRLVVHFAVQQINNKRVDRNSMSCNESTTSWCYRACYTTCCTTKPRQICLTAVELAPKTCELYRIALLAIRSLCTQPSVSRACESTPAWVPRQSLYTRSIASSRCATPSRITVCSSRLCLLIQLEFSIHGVVGSC